MPSFSLRYLYKSGFIQNFEPAVGCIDKGDFSRLKPFSTEFGYDRGGPVDRFYIEAFLAKNRGSIKGRVLEIGDNDYTLAFGGTAEIQSDILHVDGSNVKATLIGDISNAPQIDDDTFDCIILTQTLHLIYDFKGALNTCFRILKKGGTLLLTAPGITPIDHGEWKETWYWSFTERAFQRMMEEFFPSAELEINSYGNVHTASSFLYGLGQPEIDQRAYEYNDPHYPVTITVKATRAE